MVSASADAVHDPATAGRRIRQRSRGKGQASAGMTMALRILALAAIDVGTKMARLPGWYGKHGNLRCRRERGTRSSATIPSPHPSGFRPSPE